LDDEPRGPARAEDRPAASAPHADAPQDVRDFYERTGWQRTAGGEYVDTRLFVDTRAVMAPYRARARARLAPLLAGGGRYFLDAASGANPAAEFSSGYTCHVCVDFTQRALREARDQLGARGRYVHADLARLPFRDGSFQALYSAHTLYHLPAVPQRQALRELARMLAPGAPGVIVYVSAAVVRLGRWLRARTGRAQGWRPGLWPLAYGELARELRMAGLRPTLRPYQLLHQSLTRRLIPDDALGATLLAMLSRLEAALPGWLARASYMRLIVVRGREEERP
jgi:hypothetical protein